LIRKTVIILDMVAMIMTALWLLYGILKGLSSSDLMFNFLNSTVVLMSYILTFLDMQKRN